MLAICSFKRGEKAFNTLFYPAVDQPFHPLPVGYKGQANSLGAVVAEKIYAKIRAASSSVRPGRPVLPSV